MSADEKPPRKFRLNIDGATVEEIANATFNAIANQGWTIIAAMDMVAAMHGGHVTGEKRLETARKAFHSLAMTLPPSSRFRRELERYFAEIVEPDLAELAVEAENAEKAKRARDAAH